MCLCACLYVNFATADSKKSKFSIGVDSTDESLPHLFPSNGDMRLVSSSGDNGAVAGGVAGRLEVYIHSMYCSGSPRPLLRDREETDGSWGTVCGQGFSLSEAHVVCRQLGYRGALKWDYSIHTE